MLAPFIYMYLFFFSLLVWQGVSTSGKNAEEPKIATCGCQLTAGYAASFFQNQISFINHWPKTSRDLRASNRAYENSVSHRVCVNISGIQPFLKKKIYLLISACNMESSCDMYQNSFVGTFCLSLLSVQVCLWLYGMGAPPCYLSSKTQRYDLTEAQQSTQKTFGGTHCWVITVITAWRIN